MKILDTVTYIRDSGRKVIILRLLGAVILLCLMASLWLVNTGATYLVAVLWMSLAFIKVTSIWKSDTILVIRQYRLFALHQATYDSFDQDIRFDLVNYEQSISTYTDTWLDLLLIFSSRKERIRGVVLRKGWEPGQVAISLTKEEYNQLALLLMKPVEEDNDPT